MFASFIYDTQIGLGGFDAEATIFVLLCAIPFVGTSIFLFNFIKRHYPSTRVSMTAGVFFYVFIVVALALEVLYFLFLLNSMRSTAGMLRDKFSDIPFLLRFLGLLFMMLLQLFNSVAGLRLIRTINRNNKIEFSDSF
jgi:hypothetical protein